ncbi:MAG: halocarboxylic acid dehydrogenase DehI family protein [Chloroflexi bacterium]|nr:halocarboxylic acid dehydrogenase DehI family protein [Chloroflexota bacterium]
MKTLQFNLVEPNYAPAEVREIYQDVQNVLGVPWVPALFQGYAIYPPFLELIWRRMRTLAQTDQFLEDALDIAEEACQRMSQIYKPGYHGGSVFEGGPEHGVREQICHTLRAFEYGNPQLFILQAALTRALEGEVIEGRRIPSTAQRRGESPFRWLCVHLVGETEAQPKTRRIYADIRQTLGVPLVNSDYRALARWPDYLAVAWNDLKPLISSEAYRREQNELAEKAILALDRFAHPFWLSAEDYCSLGLSETDVTNIRDVAGVFWGLLPGLILNVAGFLQALPTARVSHLGRCFLR